MSQPRPRRVFGRVRTIYDGKPWTLELTKAGLSARQKHSRKPVRLTLSALIDLATGQRILPL